MGFQKDQGPRNKLFSFVFIFLLLVMLGNDLLNLMDECLFHYALLSLFCFFNVSLYVWWWYKNGKASDVYKWLVVLMAGIFVTNAGNAHSRYYYSIGDMGKYTDIISTVAWKYRMVPSMVALSYMTALIITRLRNGSNDD